MPPALTPHLIARLQKRGILKEGALSGTTGNATSSSGFAIPRVPGGSAQKVPQFGVVIPPEVEAKSWQGCPNKSNPYHICVDYCRLKWASGFSEPEKFTEKKRQLMLLKYPKPPGWKEIYDPGTGRHYYWNVETDEVSWFPPEHPKACITVSANKLRAILLKTNFRPTPEVAKHLYRNAPCVTTLISEFSNDSSAGEVEGDGTKQQLDVEYGGVPQRRGGGKMRYKPNKEKEPLDPMDPSAYSDVPRGGWGTGLETGAEAKTGVDSTASGPLFQSRPYPSPGAILRRNAGIIDKKNK